VSRPAAGTRPTGTRWSPALWAVLAVGTALLAAVLAGGLVDETLGLLLTTTITRAGMDAVGVACVGVGLVGVLLPLGPGAQHRELTQLSERMDRALVALSGLWLGLALVDLVSRTAAAYGLPVTQLGGTQFLRFVTVIAAGRGLVLSAACAALVLVGAIVRLRSPERFQLRVLLVVALLGLLTPAVTGHAGTNPDHELAVITVALHVGAASLWVGGLGAMLMLVVPRRRELLEVALPRFSRLAGVSIFTVAVTGVITATDRITSFAALVTTGYGWLVVAKSVSILLIGGLGWVARQRLAADRLPVLRWAGLEVALMAITLGLAAALGQTGNL
jgi:putative copper resistance protein D